MEHALTEFDTGGCLHPAVGGENPEGRDKGTGSDHDGGEQMNPGGYLVAAKQQHPQERRLQEECGDYLITQDGAQEVGRGLRERAPVGTELE